MSDPLAETAETPIPERPDPEAMSVKELREEYQTFDVAAIPDDDHERWKRAFDVWEELESRDVVEFPACSREGCDSRSWRFEIGGPANCAECGKPVIDAEQSREVHDAARRLIYGGGSA